MFQGFPDNLTKIDAVYERPHDGRLIFFAGKAFHNTSFPFFSPTYFIVHFKGAQYWIFDGVSFVENSPRPLSDLGLPSNLPRIDAAFVWGKNDKTYFFSGDRYWRYNEYAGQIEDGYPMAIGERWRGVPDDIDAGFTWKDGESDLGFIEIFAHRK